MSSTIIDVVQAIAGAGSFIVALVFGAVASYYSIFNRRMFHAQISPAVELSIKTTHADRYENLQNFVNIRNFSPYSIIDLDIDYGFCGWLKSEDETRTTRVKSTGRYALAKKNELKPSDEISIPINDALLHCINDVEYQEFNDWATYKSTFVLCHVSFRRKVDGRRYTVGMPVRAQHIDRKLSFAIDPRMHQFEAPETEGRFIKWGHLR